MGRFSLLGDIATKSCGHLPLTMANQTKQFGVEGIVLASRCNAFSIKKTTFWGLIGHFFDP